MNYQKLFEQWKNPISCIVVYQVNFLSHIATPITFPLSAMFNDMFREGFFPDEFKLALVTAIWTQNGLKSWIASYCPICLLSTLSKICESVMHQRLLSHLTENSLISDRQAAYMKGESTTNQLIYLTHLIHSTWASGNIAHVLFPDVAAAFEKVLHNGLLS